MWSFEDNEDFFLGSPQKREQHHQQFDEQTLDSTPEKDNGYNEIVPIFTKMDSGSVFQEIDDN